MVLQMENLLETMQKEILANKQNGSHLRKSDEIPYAAPEVTFIQVNWDEHTISFSSGKNYKQTMLKSDPKKFGLFVAWTGKLRTDIFEMDRVKASELLESI